jgi:DNA-binding transcriptional regulator YhcF (GntR family)
MSFEASPKVQSAIQFVVDGIESGRFAPGELLPPIRKLAVEAKVSLVTMWKAVNSLKEEGRLAGKSGHVPRVTGQRRQEGPAVSEYVWPAPGAAESETPSNRLVARIRKDILNGRFQPGASLPHFKQLQVQYRTSIRTLRRVLTGLCAQGVLEACGRGFAAPRFSSGKTNAAIGVIAYEYYLQRYYLRMPQGHDYLRDTHLLASQAGLRLIVEPYHTGNGGVMEIDPGSPLFSGDGAPNILGNILVLSDSPGIDPLLRKLVSGNKPLSILEQNGYWQIPAWLRRYPVMVIPVGITPDCGEVMGRFLLSLGHRKIAFFSPYHAGPWSVARLRGLCTAFEQAGLPDAVLPCVINYNTWFNVKDPSAAPKLTLEWPAKYKSTVLRRETEIIESMLRGKVDDLIALRHALQGLFERAFRDENITAWVAANDDVGMFVLEFLRDHGVKVPQDISVASFDDTFDANANQLTSFNFNLPAIMNAALQHILRNETAPSAKRAKIVHIDGMVVVRQSTGPAPARHVARH